MDQDAALKLVVAIVRGDVQAEKGFFEGFRNEVEFFVRLKIGRHNPDWQDLQQEIFADLFKRIRNGEYDHRRGRVGAFVQSTVKFKTLDYLKSRHFRERRQPRELPEYGGTEADEELIDQVVRAEEMRNFEVIIQKLPEPHRTILVDYFFKSLKIHEIAARLNLEEQKISNYKSYALSLIKKKLQK
jgi:RNA polymerase sigma factor (sigma-70 family)